MIDFRWHARKLSLRVRMRLADELSLAAYTLDPSRPYVRENPHGGFTISVGSIDLARIDPGHIVDTREVRE